MALEKKTAGIEIDDEDDNDIDVRRSMLAVDDTIRIQTRLHYDVNNIFRDDSNLKFISILCQFYNVSVEKSDHSLLFYLNAHQ